MSRIVTNGESKLAASFFPRATVQIGDTVEHCQRHGFPILTHPFLPTSPDAIRFAICALENAVVFGEDFILLSGEELLIGGLVHNPNLFVSGSLKGFFAKEFTICRREPSPAFLVGGSENFGHFLFNYFSRLFYLLFFEDLQGLPIITSGTAHPNHDELLQLAGWSRARQIKIVPDQAVLFEKFICTDDVDL